MLVKTPQRLLNDVLIVGTRKTAVRRDDQIGIGARLVHIVGVAVIKVRTRDRTRAAEDLLDLTRDRVEKRARFGKVFLRPPHLGRGDEIHRVRHLLRAADALDMLADLLHA